MPQNLKKTYNEDVIIITRNNNILRIIINLLLMLPVKNMTHSS